MKIPIKLISQLTTYRRDYIRIEYKPFIYVPEYPFVIYKPYQIAVVSNEVVRHMKAQHAADNKAKYIHNIIKAIPGIISNQEELKQWSVPPPTTAPIPWLPPPKPDGLGCDECPYVARQLRRIKQHYRVHHRWINHRTRSRRTKESAAADPAVPWRTGVQCQRFFRNRVASSWFEVGRSIPSSSRGDSQNDVNRKAEFIKRIQQEDKEAFESEANARVQDISDKWEAQRWLKRCGWPRHLANIDKMWLRKEVLQPIGENEPVLQTMWEIFECVLDNAYVATSRCSPGTAELFEMERKEIHITPNKPFEGIMEPDAWIRYKGH
ncbi:hypothetical protein BGZ61DRAFT_498117 [Ilyonectria robusta]|uniref:uncharacterized protein n=1 Tax=Ilyonectria robusta TaxID=1079257 RepID=UPI001E8EC495|nr:uncharacterized protein BGZ61DRAFT_498117 [Ilyonectria robusta]KAH8669335.1 hypothetical protein BGZ61DRAFT_498117 [Ilyonectria robusta]